MINTWVSRYVQNVIAALFIEVELTKYILAFLSCGNLCAGLLGSRSVRRVK